MERQQLLYAGDQHIHIYRGVARDECPVSRAEKYVYNQVSQERS